MKSLIHKKRRNRTRRTHKNPYKKIEDISYIRGQQPFIYDKYYIWNISPFYNANFYALIKFIYYDDKGFSIFKLGKHLLTIPKIIKNQFFGPFSSEQEAKKIFYKVMPGNHYLRMLETWERESIEYWIEKAISKKESIERPFPQDKFPEEYKI